ncbi:PGF-CTERM sorting domain-containing protein, partial [Haloarcula sp. JP-Z28]
MTGNSDKIRSLFLTALMVFSVFAGTIAFSGGAAAAANVEIQQATEYNADTGPTIEVVTNSTISTSLTLDNGTSDGDVQVVIDGVENPGEYVDTSQSGSNINQNGQQIELLLEKDITPDAEVDVRLNGVTAS